jgi:hypothetical protein
MLCAADAVLPVERGRGEVANLNHAIRGRLGGANEIPYLALPCGTAVKINEAIRGLLRSNQQGDASEKRTGLAFSVQKTGKSSRKNRERFSPNRFNL